MDPSSPFNNAPDLQRDFHAASDELRPPIDAVNWPTQDEVEHLDLADRAYTPGGDLEYRVHQAVRYERSTQIESIQPSTDAKALDFEKDFRSAAAPTSPADLRAQIDKELAELGPEFERSSSPDRGGPDR